MGSALDYSSQHAFLIRGFTKGGNMYSRTLYSTVVVFLSGISLLFPVTRTAQAVEFPSRPVEVIINYAPGGTMDLAARMMGTELSKALGVSAILTNKGGGGGAVGAEYVASAKPDGYTVLATPSGVFTILPMLTPGLHYNLSDFIPLCKYSISPNVIVVRKNSPYKSFADIIADAKKNPGKLTGATIGMGTLTQFTLDMIKILAGVDIAALPYRSGGEVNISLLGGQVDFASTGFAPTLGLLQSGDLRALAITTGKEKIKGLPNVPTLEELGYPEASLPIPCFGYFLPKGTPKPIANKLAAIFEKAMKNPTVEKNLENAGQFLAYQDGTAFTRYLIEERKVMEYVARKTKLIK